MQAREESKMATSTSQEDEEILETICLDNGLNSERLKNNNGGRTVTCLEMFFAGYHKIRHLNLFPKLQILRIMSQQLTVMEGLSTLSHLTELWICETKIQQISGLENCRNLKKLYLYANCIYKIENLTNLYKLNILWLNDNKIKTIEGLESLVNLSELNLSNNRISKIGNALDSLTGLVTLNLSGNNLYSFKDLAKLVHLPWLRSLGLKDPLYKSAPVTSLCNYSTYILYHLPHITRLDGYDVSAKALKDLAETTVTKKRMYYNMRVRTLERNTTELLAKLEKEKDNLKSYPCERVRVLTHCLKEIERELEEEEERMQIIGSQDSLLSDRSEAKPVTPDTDPNMSPRNNEGQENEDKGPLLMRKAEALKDRIKKWLNKCSDIEKSYEASCLQVKSVSNLTIQRLLSELQSGGNVRFEDGKPSDLWYTSCHDLLLSRFCTADYKELGIVGLKVQRVTRIHNRMLRSHFDGKMDSLSEKEEGLSMNKNGSYKKHLEYLFYVWHPSIADQKNEALHIIENGFRPGEYYKSCDLDEAVPLTNSLLKADQDRINHMKMKTVENGIKDLCPFRHGQLIIAKVFVGKTTQSNVTSGSRLLRHHYPEYDTVLRKITKGNGKEESCDCSSSHYSCLVFDHNNILPEYTVDFEYITRLKPRSSFVYYYGDNTSVDSPLNRNNTNAESGDCQVDEEVLNMGPDLRIRPRLVTLSEELILSQCGEISLSNITSLNLHGNGLSRLKHISSLINLKRLVVSFNELLRLDDLVNMVFLEFVDASFNKISSLEGVKGCGRLRYLNVSWNELHHTREELGMMRKHMPAISELDTRENLWQKPETLRMRAIGRLRNLIRLDGVDVTDDEKAMALRMAAASRISPFAIQTHSRTDSTPPRTLSLVSTAKIMMELSKSKPVKTNEEDCKWFSKITSLYLDNQHLGKLSNLDKLENLRWATFNNNDITKIEGFDGCTNLEELSLRGNCIAKFEGVGKLSQLKSLDLGDNCISSIDTGMLEKLPNLRYFNIESNLLTSFQGIQRATSLQELYLGNNQVMNIREVFNLKNISSLIILDLCGNPVASISKNYRLFVVYHLKSLKALDGIAVEIAEEGVAKDQFGGRMTPDFIAERIGHSNFSDTRELDFPHCNIRTVELGGAEMFHNLRSVNLEHNNLTSFGGLIHLVNLKVLCLNHNHIECIVSKPKATSPLNNNNNISRRTVTTYDITNPENFTPLLESLEVLHLGYNAISNMGNLQLSRLPSLKALFLQGNEITKVEGLEGLQELRELVLDRNKIKGLSEYSFMSQWKLTELHMEENRLKDLSNLHPLENLQRLYLGMNRVQDMVELEKLENLMNLIEVSVISNPVTRRLLHRPMMVFRQPNLLCVDGIPVTNEERTKAELYFIEQQGGFQNVAATLDTALPGIVSRGQAPLRVTTMHLSNNEINHDSPDSKELPRDGNISYSRSQVPFNTNNTQGQNNQGLDNTNRYRNPNNRYRPN